MMIESMVDAVCILQRSYDTRAPDDGTGKPERHPCPHHIPAVVRLIRMYQRLRLSFRATKNPFLPSTHGVRVAFSVDHNSFLNAPPMLGVENDIHVRIGTLLPVFVCLFPFCELRKDFIRMWISLPGSQRRHGFSLVLVS